MDNFELLKMKRRKGQTQAVAILLLLIPLVTAATYNITLNQSTPTTMAAGMTNQTEAYNNLSVVGGTCTTSISTPMLLDNLIVNESNGTIEIITTSTTTTTVYTSTSIDYNATTSTTTTSTTATTDYTVDNETSTTVTTTTVYTGGNETTTTTTEHTEDNSTTTTTEYEGDATTTTTTVHTNGSYTNVTILKPEPLIDIEIQAPEKAVRGISVELTAIVNSDTAISNVILTWQLPDGFTTDSKTTDCGTIAANSSCSSSIKAATSLSTHLGINDVKVLVSYG